MMIDRYCSAMLAILVPLMVFTSEMHGNAPPPRAAETEQNVEPRRTPGAPVFELRWVFNAGA
jgi:hypothetical protein